MPDETAVTPAPPEHADKPWPHACLHTGSCSRNRMCMYIQCAHQRRDIRAEIDAEVLRLGVALTKFDAAMTEIESGLSVNPLIRITVLETALAARDAEIERLHRIILSAHTEFCSIIYEATHLSTEKPNGSHDCTISKYALEHARSGLAKLKGALLGAVDKEKPPRELTATITQTITADDIVMLYTTLHTQERHALVKERLARRLVAVMAEPKA